MQLLQRAQGTALLAACVRSEQGWYGTHPNLVFVPQVVSRDGTCAASASQRPQQRTGCVIDYWHMGQSQVEQMRAEGVLGVILPKDRDPRFVTIRRGGTLTDSDHQLLALWAASCAEHVLGLFESAQPEDPRPRQAIEHARAWVRGEVKMTQARAAGGHAMGAARDLRGGHGMLHTLRARPGPSRTSLRTNSVLLPMQSRRHVLPRRRVRAGPQDDVSAGGSVTSSRKRFASSYLTTSGCGTTSAGQYLTAERASGH